MGEKPSIERQIARTAAAQHGNISAAQLLAIGVGRDAIDYRVRTGRVFRIYRGVYSVGRPPVTPHERAAAAVLACGRGAVLSHGSAMCLWGFWQHWAWPAEVIVPIDRRPRGIRTHLSAKLARRDATTHYAIRVTSPARTMLDIAPRMSERGLARAVSDARLSRHLHMSALIDVVERNPNHPGARRLAPLLGKDGPTRSVLEDKFQRFCERFGLSIPKVNAIVDGYEVDAYFEAERVIVELDGYEFHVDRYTFENDRERDAHALVHGRVTIRITEDRIDNEPEREAARLHSILRARRR